MIALKRAALTSVQFSSELEANIGSNVSRFRFSGNSKACTALIILLFRFEYIGGSHIFSYGKQIGNVSFIQYFATSAFLFLPLLYMFLFIGHYSKFGCLVIGRIVPVTHGVGYTMLAITALQAISGIIIACEASIFFISTFSTKLPWMNCDKSWGPDCVGLNEMENCLQLRPAMRSNNCFNNFDQLSAYKYRLHSLREYITPQELLKMDKKFWSRVHAERALNLFCCTMLVLLFSDLEGTSDNKVTNVFYILCALIMIILTFICLLSLKTGEGVIYLFRFDTDSLIDYNMWFHTALFFVKVISVSNVCATLIGSYLPIIAMADLQAFIIWIGLMTLYATGELMTCIARSALASSLDTKYNKLSAGPADTIFVLYPQFFGSIRFAPQLLSGVYFFLVLISCLLRVKLLLAAMYHTMADEKPVIRLYSFYIRIFSCVFLFFIASPICLVGNLHAYLHLLRVLDECLSVIVLIMVSLCVLYIYGTQTLCDDHHFTYGSQPAVFFKVTLLAAPAVLSCFGALVFLKVSDLHLQKPDVSPYFYSLLAICLACQVVGLLYITSYYLKRQNLAHLLQAEESWGNPNSQARKDRIIYHPRRESNYFRRIDVCKHECLRYNRVLPVLVRDETNIEILAYRKLKKESKLFSEEELGIQNE